MSLKRKAILFGIAAAALVGSTAVTLAATAFATSNVNVRSGPGTGYGAVDVLRRGEGVDIDYCRGSWCFVIKAGPDGWVSASYLSRGGDFYDDDYYGDDDAFYIERPRYRQRIRPYYIQPRSSVCVGGPNASFCITD
jgi:hypothetical protein